MKKSFLFLSVLIFNSFAMAENFTSSIHSISYGTENEPALLKLNNGRVVFVKDDEKSLLQAKGLAGLKVKVDVDDENNLKGIYSLPDESLPSAEANLPPVKAEATVLANSAEASRIFKGMNRSYLSKSECTDRAQVWAYEEQKKNNLVSRKAFLFFTNTYIRSYNFYWWFHVSPYTLVSSAGSIQERILDRRFTSGPRAVKTWTDVFVKSRKSCPVTTYRFYRSNNDGPEHCFLVKADMYYRLPLHVRNLEDSGSVKTQFSESEVNFSYRAFRERGVLP